MPAPVKVMVTGSRRWSDADAVHDELDRVVDDYPGRKVVVLQGECPTGADAHARSWCELEARECIGFPPDPSLPRREAFLARNQAMVDEAPDVVLAFVDPDSRGTWHALTAAIEAGLEVRSFGSEIADAELVSQAREAASKLLADGGWRIARRRSLAMVMASLRVGVAVPPGLAESIQEELAR